MSTDRCHVHAVVFSARTHTHIPHTHTHHTDGQVPQIMKSQPGAQRANGFWAPLI